MFWTNQAETRQNAIGIWRAINVKDLQLGCARVLQETLIVPVLTYDSETLIWKDKERSREGCTDGQPQRIAGY